MTPGRGARAFALALALCGVLAGLAPPTRAEDPWYELYQDALKSIQSRKWAEAEKRLKAAMSSGPRPGRQVRMYGVRAIDYLPEYQLGLVYFNERNYADALEQLAKVQASGLVKEGDPEFEPLKDMLQLVRIRVSPATAEDKGDANLVGVARDLMKQGNLVEARRVLDAARDKYPQSAPVLAALLDLGRLETERPRATPAPPATTLAAQIQIPVPPVTRPAPPPTTLAAPPVGGEPVPIPVARRRLALEAFYSGRYLEAAASFERLADASSGSERGRLLTYAACSRAGQALFAGSEANAGELREARRLLAEAGAAAARVFAADRLISPAVRRALQP